jgi:hypothetical protein
VIDNQIQVLKEEVQMKKCTTGIKKTVWGAAPLCLILIILIAVMLCACKDEQEPPGSQEIPLIIGVPQTLYDWEITLSSVEIVPDIPLSASLSYKPQEGNQFVVVSLTITCKAEEGQFFIREERITNQDVFPCIEYGDEAFKMVSLPGYDQNLVRVKFEPDQLGGGVLVFEVPERALNDSQTPLVLNIKQLDQRLIYELRQ